MNLEQLAQRLTDERMAHFDFKAARGPKKGGSRLSSRICRVCKTRRLGTRNRSGICARCQNRVHRVPQ